MANVIIIIILVVLLALGVRSCIQHFNGEGSCCGGPKEKVPHKKIKGQKLKVLTVKIAGMQCQNCKNRVEKKLDELDGVTARVSLENRTAKVSLYKDVDTETIREAIESLDFTVKDIQEKKLV